MPGTRPATTLFSLPSELRLLIYDLLFGDLRPQSGTFEIKDQVINSTRMLPSKATAPSRPTADRLALIRTCKQIHRETMDFLYHNMETSIVVHAHRRNNVADELLSNRINTSYLGRVQDVGIWTVLRDVTIFVKLTTVREARRLLVERLSGLIRGFENGRRLDKLELELEVDEDWGMPSWVTEVVDVLEWVWLEHYGKVKVAVTMDSQDWDDDHVEDFVEGDFRATLRNLTRRIDE